MLDAMAAQGSPAPNIPPTRTVDGGNGARDGLPSQQRPKPVMEEPKEEEVNETHEAPRRQNTPHPRKRPERDRTVRRSSVEAPLLAVLSLAGGDSIDDNAVSSLIKMALKKEEEEDSSGALVGTFQAVSTPKPCLARERSPRYRYTGRVRFMLRDEITLSRGCSGVLPTSAHTLAVKKAWTWKALQRGGRAVQNRFQRSDAGLSLLTRWLLPDFLPSDSLRIHLMVFRVHFMMRMVQWR